MTSSWIWAGRYLIPVALLNIMATGGIMLWFQKS